MAHFFTGLGMNELEVGKAADMEGEVDTTVKTQDDTAVTSILEPQHTVYINYLNTATGVYGTAEVQTPCVIMATHITLFPG